MQKNKCAEKLTKTEIRDSLNYLKDFLKILEDHRIQTQGSDKWEFTLKLWSKNKENNLKQFEEEWENKRPNKSKTSTTNFPENEPKALNLVEPVKSDIPINWCEVCSKMLEPQRRITSNFLMQESAKKDKAQIYIPLALVHRTKSDKRKKDNFSPDEGTHLYKPEYEIQQRFEHEAFLNQILERGEGKTKGQQIAVIGEPGAGKTTLLQTIAFWILEKNLGLPIWISLADLKQKDIQTYIDENWLKEAFFPTELTQEVREDFTRQIHQGKLWLLLDGIDEITGTENSHQTLHEIARQLNRWIKCSSRIVLTCRLNIWQADINALEIFETYRLLDFDYPEQVHQFIDNWFGKQIEKGERLKTELDSSERVRLQDLVQTPLRLALLCGIWETEEGNLPETKKGLYHQCVDQFYRWKENRFLIKKEEQGKLNLALGSLAFRDINESDSRFRLRESFIIENEKLGYPDDETSLFYKALQLGWLNHVGIADESPSREKVYAFYHATFEEYFAALYVDNWHIFLNHVPENPEQGIYRIFEPQWKEVILLWLGRKDIQKQQKEEFIKALIEFDDGCKSENPISNGKGFYEYRAYFLAAEGIAEFKDCSLADAVVKQIVKWGFGYLDTEIQDEQRLHERIQEKARDVLLKTEREEAIAALVDLSCHSQDEYTRVVAAKSLGEIAKSNSTAISVLVASIRDSQDAYTRLVAAKSLGETVKDNPTAITILVDLSYHSQDEYTRRQAVETLGKIAKSNPTAITVLVDLSCHSQDKYTRRQAVETLGKIAKDNPTAITVLVDLSYHSQDEYTRRQAVETLGKIAKDNSTVINALVALIGDSQDESTRRQAAESLGKIAKDNSTVINALVALIGDSQDESTRRQAAESLGKIAKDNPTAINALVALIGDSQDESTRRQAAESLGKIAKDNPTTITALVNLIRDSHDEYTCWVSVKILEKINKDNPIAINTLVNLIGDSHDEYTRWVAVEILGEIAKDNPTAITALVNLIGDSHDEYTRWVAAEILGEIAKDNPTAITALVNLIGDSQNEYTRWVATASLGKIAKDNPTAITALVNLIGDSQNEYTRWVAAASLGKIAKDNPTAITALVNLIGDSHDEDIRWVAAASLGKIAKDNPTAITALVNLIGDSHDEYTRREAVESLGKIAKDNSTTITALVNAIRNSHDEDIHWVVAESLEKIAKDNPTAITALVNLIGDSQNEYTRWVAAESLGKIAKAKDNPTTITALVNAIRNSHDEYTRWVAAKSLEEILTESENIMLIVTPLKNYVSDEAYQIIFHCSQIMNYPAFYQAWHS